MIAYVKGTSQSAASSNAPLSIASTSDSAIVFQTPVATSGIDLIYKLTLKVVA